MEKKIMGRPNIIDMALLRMHRHKMHHRDIIMVKNGYKEPSYFRDVLDRYFRINGNNWISPEKVEELINRFMDKTEYHDKHQILRVREIYEATIRGYPVRNAYGEFLYKGGCLICRKPLHQKEANLDLHGKDKVFFTEENFCENKYCEDALAWFCRIGYRKRKNRELRENLEGEEYYLLILNDYFEWMLKNKKMFNEYEFIIEKHGDQYFQEMYDGKKENLPNKRRFTKCII